MKEPYYPVIPGSDNPYRDGYVTHAPKKPRPSYLLFQHSNRMEFQSRYPNASVSEIMTLLGNAWKNMSEIEQAPYIHLAAEETAEYERHKALCDKGQKPTDVWQPMRRCRMVLDRLSQDSFSDIFQEPVDTQVFTDYEDVVDTPMDIGTVRDKLQYSRYPYQAPEMFARDMRKIWHNCKIYNQHGSAIWHVADYMQKQFERLYQAWVANFREKHQRWVEPTARPWLTSCRACDGKCQAPDNEMIVCDHCDAMYGMGCLRPPLKRIPQGIWRCPECRKQAICTTTSNKTRMLSAVSEQAARKRAELGDVPKKRRMQRKYLVKWVGLGYEACSWETAKDINDDALIAEYKRLNHMVPDEPLLEYAEVQQVLQKAKHECCRTNERVDELRGQLYAQTRAFQFGKFGRRIPDVLVADCGPVCKTNRSAEVGGVPVVVKQELELRPVMRGEDDNLKQEVDLKKEVERAISQMEYSIGNPHGAIVAFQEQLPKCLTGEYEIVVPVSSEGLMMNVGEMNGSVSFLG